MEPKEMLANGIYTIENEMSGQTIINGVILETIKNTKENYILIINHVICEINKSLLISKKYNNKTCNVHVYLKGCSLRNLPLTTIKKLIDVLSITFEDTLNYCYIYDVSNIAALTWNIIKRFIDPVTKKKVILIKSSKNHQ